MFCPFCGQANGTPGLNCVRCGQELPRSKGGTVVVDEQVEQGQPAASPTPEEAPIDLAATFPSGGAGAPGPSAELAAARAALAAPVQPPVQFVPQISRRAVSYEGTDPDSPGLIPQPLPTPRPIAAIPPSPDVAVLPPTRPVTPSGQDLAVTKQSFAEVSVVPVAQTAGADVLRPVIAAAQPAGEVSAAYVVPSEGRSGLVWRALSGSASLLSGNVLIVVFLFLMPAWTGGMRVYDAPSFAPGILALAAAITGVLELTAGLRMLAGSPLPHAGYGLAVLAQFGCSAVAVLISAWDDRYGRLDGRSELWLMAALLGAALMPSLVRMIALLVPASARTLGARDLGAGVPIRPVPFVLWGPVTAIMASPLLILLVIGSGLALSQALAQGDTVGFVIGLVIALLLVAVMTANLAAGIGMLRRATWSVALGGVSGLLGSVLGVGAVITTIVLIAIGGRTGFEVTGAFASAGLALSAILTPSLVLASGAIKFRFRLPPYLGQPDTTPGSPRRGLMEILVPLSPAD